jgi:hydroxyjasmonate sulfotransferase
MQEFFQPRPSDIILTSFPKSGTTWLKSLLFTVAHRSKYAISSHPLLELNPHDCVPQLEYIYALLDDQSLETLPSPRVLATHVPYSMLPESIKTSKCRIIYICRDPKDALVSLWHMMKKLEVTDALPFAQMFQLFCDGRVPYGPIWEHVLEYYSESLQNPDKILFMRYEEMMTDPLNGVIRLANFIGKTFTEEEVKEGVVEEVIKICSFDELKNLDVNKNKSKEYVGDISNHSFFRKAVVGDWQNHMTAEMAAKLDEIIKKKLHDSSFSY